MRILVTGVTGFVGRHLVSAWRTELPDAKLWGVTHEKDQDCSLLPNLVAADLRNAEEVQELCREVAPDWVVHLAAQSFVPQAVAHPRETWAINCWGTLHLVEALRECGFTGRFLFVGSGDQYGTVQEEELPIRETHLLRPRNAYAASKAAAELLCYQYTQSYGLGVILARSFNHIGPGQSPRFVVADFARQVARIDLGLQDPVLSVGNLEVTRDFLDVRDVVEAYCRLLQQGEIGEAYNVCSGREIRLIDLVRMLVGFASRPIEIRVDQTRFRPADTPRLCGSHEKLTAHTGWRPQRDIVETLGEMVAYWKEEERR
jgi:GDP-4-dehydro-6-deoxy-D-mannose reductase